MNEIFIDLSFFQCVSLIPFLVQSSRGHFSFITVRMSMTPFLLFHRIISCLVLVTPDESML